MSTSLPNDPIGDGRYALNGKVYVFCPLKSEPLTDLSPLNNNPARVIIKIDGYAPPFQRFCWRGPRSR